MKLVYPAIFTPFGDREGFTVELPDLPGCVTEGDNLAEAIEMGMDAASGWILGEIEEGNNYPAASAANQVEVPEGSFVNLLVLDMDAYAEKYGDKAIRKNITIPAYMNTYIEKNGISLSKITQDAIGERMQG